MKIAILNHTFVSDGTNVYGRSVGTVSVDLGRETVTTRAVYARADAGLDVAGFVGRYQTSPKPWVAHVSGRGENLFVHFGRDDRSGRFNKRNAISFEPATFEGLTNAAYWAAAAKKEG